MNIACFPFLLHLRFPLRVLYLRGSQSLFSDLRRSRPHTERGLTTPFTTPVGIPPGPQATRAPSFGPLCGGAACSRSWFRGGILSARLFAAPLFVAERVHVRPPLGVARAFVTAPLRNCVTLALLQQHLLWRLVVTFCRRNT